MGIHALYDFLERRNLEDVLNEQYFKIGIVVDDLSDGALTSFLIKEAQSS